MIGTFNPRALTTRAYSGNRKPQTGHYLYVAEHAHWFSWRRKAVPMCNREHVSVQSETPTRRVIGEQARDFLHKKLPAPAQMAFDMEPGR